MNFIEKILTAIGDGISFVGNAIFKLIEFLAIPLGYLLTFLEGIFYFIYKLGTIIYLIITLFVALFQYFFAVVTGLLRTISSWVGFTPSTEYNLPGASRQGFDTALSQIGGTGLLTVVPLVLIAISWIYFVIKVVGTLGNKGSDKV